MKIKDKDLSKEAGKINWKELERFFASGKLIFVDKTLNIIDIAHKINIDDTNQIKSLIENNELKFVSDKQAKSWSYENTQFISIVVAPWVLIQKTGD